MSTRHWKLKALPEAARSQLCRFLSHNVREFKRPRLRLGDRNGQTLRETLNRALTNNPALVQIVTWNDFGEGTTIEPTKEYGFRDLYLIQDLCRQKFAPASPSPTNDLASALRFYHLRHDFGTNADTSLILDQAFKDIVSGRQERGFSQMAELEAKH